MSWSWKEVSLRTVLADKKTPNSRRCYFSNVERDHRYKHCCSKPSDEPSGDEHADVHGACLQSTSNDVDKRSNNQQLLSAIRVAVPSGEDGAKEGPSGEKSEDRSDDFIRVVVEFCVRRVRRQTHRGVERRLPDRECGDAEVEAVAYAAET